ncbi:MAG: FKBP-type peptidyl-prolyl cis-trans isomerase [Thermoanaerobaculia bacterium]|nr:FKBP-type peptidyl-prolyl cis-trans isomerase [Thermoanaerobaculia bacterium]
MNRTTILSRALLSATALFGAIATVPCFAAPTPDEARTPPPEAIRHTSGLVTLLLEKGEGESKPTGDDVVVLHFTGWDRDGKQFASTREGERPQPWSVQLSKLFPGWRQALEGMVPGELQRIWVPEHLGPKNNRGPESAVFDLELVAIRQLPEVPPLAAPEDAERSPSGARWKRIKTGTSDESPPAGGTALLTWTQWGADGKVVQSTELRGRPTAFMLDRVFLGFSEIVQEMKVGEERYLWIPSAVHGGDWPGSSPNKPLILHVELVRVLPNSMLPRQG